MSLDNRLGLRKQFVVEQGADAGGQKPGNHPVEVARG